jgi:hypothetical protein
MYCPSYTGGTVGGTPLPVSFPDPLAVSVHQNSRRSLLSGSQTIRCRLASGSKAWAAIAIEPVSPTMSVPMTLLLQLMIYLRHLEEPPDSAITVKRAPARP